jgi:lantibiotic modifying enzyme
VACGEHLLATQIEAGHGAAAWPSRDGRLLAGFAHGAAGIAYALARLFKITGNENYLEAAAAAHRFERRLFSAVHGNWPVVGAEGDSVSGAPVFMTAWCHGAPGLGLARALALDVMSDEEILAEIGSAVTTTLGAERHSSDHLCCGNLGRADFLLTVGRRLQKSELVDSARAIAGRSAERARERGHFALPSTPFEYRVFAPGFFQGLAGIGYQLLRTAAPSKLPSVLGFEAKLRGISRPRFEEEGYGKD